MAVFALAGAVNTGCEIDAEFSSPLVIDDIYVEPGDWKRAIDEDGIFNHYYCDIALPDITESLLHLGAVQTYMVYDEIREDHLVTAQEPLPYIVTGNRWVPELGSGRGRWEPYGEIIACSYEVGLMRITISRLPLFERFPDKTLYFRTVIFR